MRTILDVTDAVFLCPRCLRFWTLGKRPAQLLTAAPLHLCPNKYDCAAYARPKRRRR